MLVRGARADHLEAFLIKLKEAGVSSRGRRRGIRVQRNGKIKSVDVKTLPYPGFPTDLQAQMMVLMAIADGVSVITETIFENRFMHAQELDRMGAQIKLEGNRAVVRGVRELSGAPVMASDLRASVALVLAGLGGQRHHRSCPASIIWIAAMNRSSEKLSFSARRSCASRDKIRSRFKRFKSSRSGEHSLWAMRIRLVQNFGRRLQAAARKFSAARHARRAV